ncbi:MAG: hypothetical protein ACI9AQ_000460, partial [Dinoroseobacter sp.]
PYALRIHLQDLDIRARQVHPKPDPPNAGTKHLGRVDKAHPAMNCRDLVIAKTTTVLNITYCFASAENF